MIQLRATGGEVIAEIKDSSGNVLIVLSDGLATLDDLDLAHAVFDSIRADGLICMSTKFDHASFKSADLYWLVAIQASMRHANLENCVFRGANLSEVSFDGALLRGTRFLRGNLGGRTNLSAADLSTATIDGADFSGACYDSDTRFPYDFDPVRYGLTRCEGD